MNSDDANRWFHTTHWSMILAAREQDDSKAHQALSMLCQTYWRPLYSYLRRSGKSPHEAQDLTQSFFASLIDKEYLKSVDQQKGRFRSFLLVAIKHFVANRKAHDKAVKRGGRFHRSNLDYAEVERMLSISTRSAKTPEEEFEYNWAVTVLNRAVNVVQEEFAAASKEEEFEHLKVFLVPNSELPTYGQLSRQLGVAESGARSAVHRLRRRYRRALREQVAQTVGDRSDVEDELIQLMNILSRR